MTNKDSLFQVNYRLDGDGNFVIENYNESKLFSNFFPGIAGVWGIPMWVFYVNRAQCIASFGIESKDKAIMEFQPANKAYQMTSVQGFRTFVKGACGPKAFYWEPFQNHLIGTNFKKRQSLSISSHDLTIREANMDLGLIAEVNYFTLPEESYAALVRRITLKNTGRKNYNIEIIDGMPAIVSYGLKDWLNKHLSRTVQAWIKVKNLKARTPYYQLNVEVSDKPEVRHIKEGNFYFSFDPYSKEKKLLDPIVEAACIFGAAQDFLAPAQFIDKEFRIPKQQQTSNRTPSAMSHACFALRAGSEKQIISLFGFVHDEEQLRKIALQVRQGTFIEKKAVRNAQIVEEIKNYALTRSSSSEFDLYSSNNFLDNVLRGGLPISIKTGNGHVAYNIYSRKHGDLERDYNFFYLSPTFYSQGNGNYRDVNQNRRNDVWFNPHVQSSHLVSFMNLIQADGYNPLVVKGTMFSVRDQKKFNQLILRYVAKKEHQKIKRFAHNNFMPGELLKFVMQEGICLNGSPEEFLSDVIETCHKQESADHGEGFWSDHWTYNVDMIESYCSVYPDDLERLLLKTKDFQFYQNSHYVLPRNRRYILTERGVRQYGSVAKGSEIDGHALKTKAGKGEIYKTHLICKILCLIANKVATLDPSGIGIEMEADKPSWYDALNGLPGLLGSSVSETFEIKRLSLFLSDAIEKLDLKDDQNVLIFEELANFIFGLTHVLSLELDAFAYWEKSNDLKEHYRGHVRQGIEGTEVNISVSEIKHFLQLVVARTDKGIESAKDNNGNLATYFYHEVTEYKLLENHSEEGLAYVQPVKFKKHILPLFLEGYVHALRVEKDYSKARALYAQVRKSQLFDKKLKMYKVNADLSSQSEEIGRTRIFPAGWLENESIWLHMEYKFLSELLRCGLYEEFYENFYAVLIPFLNPEQYGRSVLDNSSFLVSSAHEDKALHGRGFVARLSGSTAEFIHIWLLMNIGKDPFGMNAKGELTFTLRPVLAGSLFTKNESCLSYLDLNDTLKKVNLPKNCYAFRLFGSILVVYHNPHRRNTFGKKNPPIREIRLTYPGKKKPVIITAPSLCGDHAHDIRERKIERVDVFFG
ncbi:MAG: hypothetical protein JW847_07315 [Candidatus Omnitrophica bacterium]|nr:hypothetical protein [Candidatus Omnitrophota bacterium]